MSDTDYTPEFRMPASWFEPPFEPSDTICPECDGKGQFPTYQNEFGVWDTETCSECDGMGWVET